MDYFFSVKNYLPEPANIENRTVDQWEGSVERSSSFFNLTNIRFFIELCYPTEHDN